MCRRMSPGSAAEQRRDLAMPNLQLPRHQCTEAFWHLGGLLVGLVAVLSEEFLVQLSATRMEGSRQVGGIARVTQTQQCRQGLKLLRRYVSTKHLDRN